MKFFLFIAFLALALLGLSSPEVRKTLRAFVARFWMVAVLAGAIAIAFWVAAYGGDSIRVF